MFSLITNETCFTVKNVHIRRHIAGADHDQIIFTLSMIETTSEGSFDLSHIKQVNANVVSLLNTASPFVLKELDE